MGYCYTNYYGLIFNCPIDVEVESCVFRDVRKLNAKDRLAFYEALTIDEKKALIEKHQQCLIVREKLSLFHESQ